MDERLLADSMQKFGDSVLRASFSVTGNRSDAEDVFSDVFFTLWQLQKSFASETHLKAWLLRIAVNKAKNVRKLAVNRRNAELSENIPAPETIFVSEVAEAMERLKPDERIVLYLHYYEGYTYGEIADTLLLRETSVRGKALRARERMKEFLSE